MKGMPATESLSPSEREHADALVARAHCGNPKAEGAAAAALVRWASGHAAREAYVRSLDAASSLMERAAPALRARYPRQVAAHRSPMSSFRGLALHAGIACTIVAVVACLVWWSDPVVEGRTLETATGEHRRIVLADGSSITLNSHSRVEVQLRLRSRSATLHEGEALFEVASSAHRPWTTLAGSARVSVLGTVFNVRRHGESVRLTVFEGRVAFDPGSGVDVVLVEAGQAAESRGGSLVSRPAAANLARAGAWREQRMVFEDTPLAEAMAEAGRYRRAAIRVDPQVAGLRITGAFPTTDPERLLALLPDALPVTVLRSTDGSVDIRPRAPEPAGAFQPPVATARPRT